MRIEQLWQEMEAEAHAGNASAWLTRFALPQHSQPLLIALETSGNRRALLLPLPRAAIPGKREWPRCSGLEIFSLLMVDQAHLGVRLKDSSCADVFAALAEDVAPRVAGAPDPRAAAAALLSRLRRWQKFLTAGSAELSVEQQRGLYGELRTLRDHFLPALGAEAAIAGWRAPRRAHQDFQIASGAVEVKATTAKQPQAVRVTSERQLDSTGIPALFLHVVVLDEREVEADHPTAGECLPDIVHALRLQLGTTVAAAEVFEDRLLDAGYLEADAPRYQNRRFTLRREHTFRVRSGFPCLVEADLPGGIGDVSYALSLAACQRFATTSEKMIFELRRPHAAGRKSQR